MTRPASSLQEASGGYDKRIRSLEGHNADLRELLGHRNQIIEEEKRAMARELHDSMGSSLTALNMYLALLQHDMPDHPAISKRLAQMKTMLLAMTDATRRWQAQLRPEKLDVFGIKVALHEFLLDFSKRTGLSFRISLPDEELELPAEHNIALFRIVEEALSNVARHANAQHIELILDDSEDGIMLTIRDDGKGIDAGCLDQASPQTHGLRAMRERAGYLGGSMELSSGWNAGKRAPQDWGGTMLTVRLPPRVPCLPPEGG